MGMCSFILLKPSYFTFFRLARGFVLYMPSYFSFFGGLKRGKVLDLVIFLFFAWREVRDDTCNVNVVFMLSIIVGVGLLCHYQFHSGSRRCGFRTLIMSKSVKC